jgi:hypothetical protein
MIINFRQEVSNILKSLWSDKNWLSLAMYASMAITDTEGINIRQGHKFEDIDYATWQFRLQSKS